MSGQEWASASPTSFRPERRRAVHRDAGLAEHPAADRRRQGLAQDAARRSRHTCRDRRRAPRTKLSVIQSYARAHPNVKGMFAVDSGSTIAVGQTIQKQSLKGKVKGGGYDLTEPTPDARLGRLLRVHDRPAALPAGLPAGPASCSSTRCRRRLTGPADVNTGLKFLDQEHSQAVRQHQEPLRGHRRRQPASPRS